VIDIFSDEIRRGPFAMYSAMRAASPVLRVPPPFDAWLIFDFDGVKRVLADHDTFSSAVPAPRNWFLFFDPPRHSRLREEPRSERRLPKMQIRPARLA